MVEKIESLIRYEERIQEIPINKIRPNPLNPRERFVETEEDELIESIISKGIVKPIVVFKSKKNDEYVILDGERRYQACKKLNIQTIPAFILVREPSDLENLSLMFHIHNVREEWTEFAISMTIKKIVEEIGKDVRSLNSSDIKELSKLTSLSSYKIKKYLTFLDYPKDVIDLFFESEKKEKPDPGVDPDILTEMYRPIKEIGNQMPGFLEEFPVIRIIKACINKKAKGIIENNKEFRLLSKALTASKNGEIRTELLRDKIIDFIENEEVSPNKIYEETSKTVYQVKSIIKNSDKLYEEISNLNLNELTKEERKELISQLKKLTTLVGTKFRIQ